MSSLTAAGKLRKSRLEDPTQCSGFSSAARTRRTVDDYPSSGMFKQRKTFAIGEPAMWHNANIYS